MEILSLERERDQTPSMSFSVRKIEHLIYSGSILLTYIHYLDTPCQGFSPNSLNTQVKAKATFTWQITR